MKKSSLLNYGRKLAVASVVAVSLTSATTIAQPLSEYPNRPITMVVAFAAGGDTDVMARALAQSMSTVLGQPVVVDNRSGAGGIIGTKSVVSAPADGYTIGFGTSSQLVINEGVHKLGFSIDKDIQMVGLVAKFPMVLYGSLQVPKPLKRFAEVARAEPGKFTFGSGGVGQSGHVFAELLMTKLGVKAVHVPYRGSAQIYPELMSGRLDLLMNTLVSGMPFVKDGKLALIAVGGTKRTPLAPDVPTFLEQGISDFDPYGWTSIFAPAKLPPPVLAKLNAAVNAAAVSESFRQKLVQQGGETIAPATAAEATEFSVRERNLWVPFIRSLKISPD